MKTQRFGTYRGCEICRSGRGWFFTVPAGRMDMGESVNALRKRVICPNALGASDVMRAVDNYRSAIA